MKIVITGTTGFVGTNLKAFLQSKGFEIVSVNRPIGKDISNTSNFNTLACSGSVWIHLAGKSKDIQKPGLLPEYLEANVNLTWKVFNAFINDVSATTFIYVSSVKAAAARVEGVLTEEDELEVGVPYGLSKRLAEKKIRDVPLPPNKKLVILRPVMIYGAGSKGNLFSLFSFIQKGIPYPFSAFDNARSLLSIDNFNYVVLQIIQQSDFLAGMYNVADDGVVSTKEIIELIGQSLGKKPFQPSIPPSIIKAIAAVGSALYLPFNRTVLSKLTESYVVSNGKLLSQLDSPLPYKTKLSLAQLFKTLATHSKK